MVNLDNSLQNFHHGDSSQFDAEEDIVPNTEDLEDTHGEMVSYMAV